MCISVCAEKPTDGQTYFPALQHAPQQLETLTITSRPLRYITMPSGKPESAFEFPPSLGRFSSRRRLSLPSSVRLILPWENFSLFSRPSDGKDVADKNTHNENMVGKTGPFNVGSNPSLSSHFLDHLPRNQSRRRRHG